MTIVLYLISAHYPYYVKKRIPTLRLDKTIFQNHPVLCNCMLFLFN